ncbi:ABC transporter substrate-binding protein [Nakamurella antarctica]|uniref:ABC transporter substrate-binding protein n=1 Tax=Nakamurella antarctica TaxID=1902245 RepID=UPI0019D0009E|nr:extracellular solute-binding protein [Nakamurella antarctica]
MAETSGETEISMSINRRNFFGVAGAAAVPLVLAGCGFTKADSGQKADGNSLTFTTWGTDSELAGFNSAITGFEAANPGMKVLLNAVPYAQMFTNIDAQLQAGNPPDIFRVPYYTFGRYAGSGQLLDLSSHVDKAFSDRFTPAAWAAVQNAGKPFGVPHHTDTSVILYNKDALKAASITSVPTALDKAWTWDEFQGFFNHCESPCRTQSIPLPTTGRATG